VCARRGVPHVVRVRVPTAVHASHKRETTGAQYGCVLKGSCVYYSVIMLQEVKLRHVCTRTHCHQDFGSVLEGSEDRRTIIAVRFGVLRWHGDKCLILLIAVARHRCTPGRIQDGITPHSRNTPSPTQTRTDTWGTRAHTQTRRRTSNVQG
jgi:hypothetical protein